jgi:hypothetical protein
MSRFYLESKVADRLALPRETLTQLRASILKKEEGHWQMQGRDVVLSEDGLLALRLHLDLDGNEDFSDCEADPEKKENGAVELIVKKVFPNRLLVEATTPSGEPVLVRVRDNRNFRPKMKLKARQPNPEGTGTAAYYQLEGRCPRYPGRY